MAITLSDDRLWQREWKAATLTYSMCVAGGAAKYMRIVRRPDIVQKGCSATIIDCDI